MAAKRRKRVKRNEDGSMEALAFLENLDGPLTFGRMIWAIRESEEISQADFAKQLGVAPGHLCDIEKGRRMVSAERAARWARELGYPEAFFVKLALQAEVDAAGLKLEVAVQTA